MSTPDWFLNVFGDSVDKKMDIVSNNTKNNINLTKSSFENNLKLNLNKNDAKNNNKI